MPPREIFKQISGWRSDKYLQVEILKQLVEPLKVIVNKWNPTCATKIYSQGIYKKNLTYVLFMIICAQITSTGTGIKNILRNVSSSIKLFSWASASHFLVCTGLPVLRDGAISHNRPQIASDRTIHEKSHNS